MTGYSTLIQFWWVWDDTESSDLWYNCRFDNETEGWFCATSDETGKTIPFGFKHLPLLLLMFAL